MDRFHVSRWKRLLVELVSDAVTMGALGSVLMLALAQPAFLDTTDKDWLKQSDLAVTFLDRYGNEVGMRGIRHNASVPLDQLPDHLIKAVLATEDRSFYRHFGIDVIGTIRAMLTNARAGGVVQGGSTITQQLAKNLFLSNERTLQRKIKEAFLAVWLEWQLSKNEILKLYLDRAYMGAGTFGVDAAAQFYFNKSARDVNLAEAAMLAGLFKAPTKYSPDRQSAGGARARQPGARQSGRCGLYDRGTGVRRAAPSGHAVDRKDERQPNYYLDAAFDEVKKLVDKLPKSVTERVFVVRTALDPGLQREAENAIENSLRQYGPEYNAHQAATVVIGSGRRRARDRRRARLRRKPVQSRHRRDAPARLLVQTLCLRTALANGMKPTSVVVDAPICLGNWCPHNYGGGYRGSMTLITALTHSINTVAVRLSVLIGHGNAKAGRAKIIATARRWALQRRCRTPHRCRSARMR